MVAYHLPNTDVRLFSPQVYHQLHGGHSDVDGDNVKMIPQGWGSTITIPIENGSSNLPCVYNSFVNDKVKKIYAFKMRSGLKASRLFPSLDFFGEMPPTCMLDIVTSVGICATKALSNKLSILSYNV